MTITAVLALTLFAGGAPKAPAAVADPVKATVAKGLKWLAGQQKPEGNWLDTNDLYPTFVTGFAGVAFLMEGSTLKHGPYAANLRKALEWVEANAKPNGLLGGNHSSERNWDLNGHASTLVFLACAYDVDDDEPRRERVAKLIEKAVAFAVKHQSVRGGWGIASVEAGAYGDSYTTVAVVQALFAVRKAGFDVPRRATERAVRYLVKATADDGRVRYDVASPEPDGVVGDPMLAAGAAVATMMSDGPRPDVLTKWVKYAKAGASPAMQNLATNPIALSQQYIMARAAYGLGDDGHRRLDPADDEKLVTWAAYKRAAFQPLADAQAKDGGWPESTFGRALTTAHVLIALQLDNGYLPAFSR